MFLKVFEDFVKITPTVWGILGALLVLFILFLFAKTGSKNRGAVVDQLYTKKIVYGGISIAISFVLSYIRFFHWPQGGSITPASMLPMFIFAFMFGPAAGIVAGVAYGFLQLIQDPFMVHWVQVLLDYPLAFGAMGLAGLGRKNLVAASFIGGFGRFFMHFLSGFIFFGEYANGQNVVLYSLTVNGILIGTETAVCMLVALVLQHTPVIQQMRKSVKTLG